MALSKGLLPLLWSSSQPSQSKASRLSAARWSSDLLKKLDLTSACHILCFLAGDTDVTASSMAREGLGLLPYTQHQQHQQEDITTTNNTTTSTTSFENEDKDGGGSTVLFPDFGEFTTVLFPMEEEEEEEEEEFVVGNNSHNRRRKRRPTYWDFSFRGKAATLRFGLNCLYNDMYGGDDSAIEIYVRAVTETISMLAGRERGTTTTTTTTTTAGTGAIVGREGMDLLDDCSNCLVTIVSTSSFARSLLLLSSSHQDGDGTTKPATTTTKQQNPKVKLSLQDIESLVLSSHSSRSRRYLAGTCGYMYEDASLWSKRNNNNNNNNNNKNQHDDQTPIGSSSSTTTTNTEENNHQDVMEEEEPEHDDNDVDVDVDVDVDDDFPLPDFHYFITYSQIHRTLQICSTKLKDMQRNLFMLGEIHGAAFLGAHAIRAFRLQAIQYHHYHQQQQKQKQQQQQQQQQYQQPQPESQQTLHRTTKIIQSCWEYASNILSILGKGTMHSDEVIGNAFADSLTIAFSYHTRDAPPLERNLYDGASSALLYLCNGIQKYSNLDHCDPIRASKLSRASGICLASTTSGAGFSGDVSGADSGGTGGSSSSSTTTNTTTDNIPPPIVTLGPARLLCAEALFNVLGSPAFRKDEEIALIVGEALANYADAYSPNDIIWSSQASDWSNNTNNNEKEEEYNDDFANQLPPHQNVLYKLVRKFFPASSPHKRTACAPALLAIVARAARGVNSDTSYANRSLVIEIVQHLSEIQNVFIKLLADPKSKHLSRESCCLGLAACRGLAKAAAQNIATDKKDTGNSNNNNSDNPQRMAMSDELNYRLLRAFGQTHNFGGSAYQETRAQAAERRSAEAANGTAEEGDSQRGPTLLDPFGVESEVGGASGMGEAALGAYREMASAAVSLGRPDVLYALLILSVSHSVWFSPGPRERYSSSSLLGEDSIVGSRTNAAEMRAALRPHLGKLIPRILRACNDPNKQTREQMTALWIGLTGGGPESRLAITEHLLPTTDVLIQDAASKLWRARVGACGSLSDILVGRSWEDLGGGPAVLNDDDVHNQISTFHTTAGVRLLRLWRVAMRALDDVRGTVRESGETLARTIRGLTIRLCDPSLPDNSSNGVDLVKHERDASAAAATTLRWLIKHGLSQPCAEATGFCVSCLVGIVDVVRPSILQPLIPGLLRSLLFAMSGLEPSVFNFLQVRSAGDSEGYDSLERLRLQMAQSGPLASAVTKCLDMLPKADTKTQKEVIPQLDTSLRLSAGFATRAATADAVSTLCATCPNAFRFSGASNTNPSVRLLRALYFASERERGQGARNKMTHALGNLAALCPGASVRSLAMKACEKYNASTGNNDDPASRRAAAAALRAIAVRASNQFSDGGQSNIWCKRVLPVAFLGQKDSDSKVANLWKEVWEEGGSAANLAPRRKKSASSSSSSSTADDDFGTSIQERLLPYLVRECAKALDDVSWSRRVAASSALVDLCNMGVLAPPPQKLNRNAKNNDDKSSMAAKRAQRRSQASSDALNACVRLLLRSRLWTGKSEVLKAAVKVAGKWVCPIAADNPDERSLFGWQKQHNDDTTTTITTTTCPWKPITVSPGQFQNDLFIGDHWFLEKMKHASKTSEGFVDSSVSPSVDAAASSSPSAAATVPAAMDIDDDPGNTEVKINFEECDDKLNEEGENEEEEEDVRSENEEGDAVVPTVQNQLNVITFAGFCQFLLDEAIPPTVRQDRIYSEEYLPYRASALVGLRDLMACLNDDSSISVQQKKVLYRMISPKLVAMFDSDERFRNIEEKEEKEVTTVREEKSKEEKEAPLLVARSIDCLSAAFWNGIGRNTNNDDDDDDNNDMSQLPTANMLELTKTLQIAGGNTQPAWTVREAATLCVASIATNCHPDTLRKYALTSTMVECAAQSLKDRKFWRVRFSGVKLLNDLVKRIGSDTTTTTVGLRNSGVASSSSSSDDVQQERQLLLEAMLPHKEEILKLARSSLTDAEAKITALSSDVLSTMSWWP